MLNINAFWLVVYEEKFYETVSKFCLYFPFFDPKRGHSFI